MNTKRPRLFAVLTCALTATVGNAWGLESEALEIARGSIDGGGVLRSTGGGYELSGTIGQPDAGVLGRDEIELTGGFWFGLAPGDCQEDGDVDLVDYDEFKACVTGPEVDTIGESCQCFDIDHSGTIDLADFAPIQIAYTGL